MSRSQKNKHLQEHAAVHSSLLLKLALNVSRDVESLMCRNPRLLSRNPGFASDYEKTISDILSQVSDLFKANRELREKLQDQSQRITVLERGVATLRVSAGTVSPIRDESGVSVAPGVPATEVGRRVTNLENKTADHEVLLEENGRNTEDLRQQNTGLTRQLEAALETIRRLERKVESHEHVQAIRNVALADLEEYVRQQQVCSYDGALLWKIDDYARRKNDAISGRQTSFYSPCFYTGRHGYKMCARVYLNGDGMGKNTHISVFFVVMRGQYDALLRWPFRQKVTIMLLDQDNVEHVIDAFRPDPNSSSFQRPRREMNVASGCPLFCSLAELNKHAYVRDDVMFMKIIVDTSDL